MDEKIEAAIENLLSQVGRPGGVNDQDKALKFSQAILNLAHAKQLLEFKKKA